jgi:116 kDa U5 small nuclear ribonucleoprotein component
MEDTILYDEFGNYIGSDLSSSSEDESDHDMNNRENIDAVAAAAQSDGFENDITVSTTSTEIVLHEDKSYYASASDIYGEGVETITMEEDTQHITEPLVKPIKSRSVSVFEKDIPKTIYESEYLTGFMTARALVRNVAVVGHLHSGKTCLLDMLIESTHEKKWSITKDNDTRYTDSRKDEQARGMSIKSCPVSLLLPDLREKNHLFNLIDTPGHIAFSAERVASIRLADGVLVVVDAIEGVLMETRNAIHEASRKNLPISLIISKCDRLIVELRLPPNDCYSKLQSIIDEVNIEYRNRRNNVGHQNTRIKGGGEPYLNPTKGNVCFLSAKHRWAFTLNSFAKKYSENHGGNINDKAFAQRLWGDTYFDNKTNKFFVGSKSKKHDGSFKRTFVSFILEPIYKIYSHVIGREDNELKLFIKKLSGVNLSKRELKLDPHPMLRLVMSRFLKNSIQSIADLMSNTFPNPMINAHKKVLNHYQGDMTSVPARSMLSCNPDGPLVINIVKQYASVDGTKFFCLGRIYSGTIRTGDRVRVLGESYSSRDDDEDMGIATVTSILIGQGRYTIDIDMATVGSIIMLEGIDQHIVKTATVTHLSSANDACSDVEIFAPLKFDTEATMKVAVEPLKPSELPKMVEALRRASKSYPLLSTKVEDSGEHIITGTGEVHLDTVLHDLRLLYSDIEIKVSDPSVCFRETIVKNSFLKCNAFSPNKKNRISMIAEPVNKNLASDNETMGIFDHFNFKNSSDRKASKILQQKYKWDALASRSIWAFGPSAKRGTNILLNDTIPYEIDSGLLSNVRESIVQGFRWSCREGPLCDEPMRQVKIRVIDAIISNDPISRGGGQIIPTARRAVNSAFLSACPRLLEPMLKVEVITLEDTVRVIYKIFGNRRGNVVKEKGKPGTPFHVLHGYLPVIESYGFETDLRIRTQGQAFCQQSFDHWSLVPGDPLDDDFIVHPLQKAPKDALARDFVIKTRRRKGLGDDLNIVKYFDDDAILEYAQRNIDF